MAEPFQAMDEDNVVFWSSVVRFIDELRQRFLPKINLATSPLLSGRFSPSQHGIASHAESVGPAYLLRFRRLSAPPEISRRHIERIDVQVRDVDIPHLLDWDIAARV